MEVLGQSNPAGELAPQPPANDDCIRIPIMRERPRYRRSALHNEKARSQASAFIVALLFCAWWVAVRAASGAEIAEARDQLLREHGAVAAERFDTGLAQSTPSLLRLHLLRVKVGDAQDRIAASAESSSG